MFSSYSADKVLDHINNVATWTPPTQLYLALFTGDAGLATNSPSSEVTGGAYARQAADCAAASSGATTITGTITFPEATADWGAITHAALMDAATGGNVITWNSIIAKTIPAGVTASISPADFSFVAVTSYE